MQVVCTALNRGSCLYCFREAGVCSVSMRQMLVFFHEAGVCNVSMRQVFVVFP